MYKSRVTGEGEKFMERKRSRVIFSECGITVAASYLKGHMKRQHVVSVLHMREMEIGWVGPVTYFGFLPLSAEYGEMLGDSLYSSSA